MHPLPLIAWLLTAAPAPAVPPAPPAPAAQPPTPGLEGVPVKVERRLLVKTKHYIATAGPCLFERGDYYNNPGYMARGSFYTSEQLGLEVKLGAFFSFLNAAGAEVFERTGLVPDAHKPVVLAQFGARYTLGYGKVQVWSNPGLLLHFDFQAAGHLGAVFTDRAVTPALSVAPALLVRFTPRLVAQLDLALVSSLEQRSRGWFAVGFLPTLTVGVLLG
jgi:hypothetical protein